MRRTTFFILCLEGAILSFNVAACSALIPSISKEFGIAQFIAAKITWLYMLPYGIAALFYGPLIRAFDAKKIELFCIFLFSLANLVAALSGNIQTFFLARFLMGVFGASVIPLALILIAEQTDASCRGKFVGIFFSATFIASLLGLALSGVIHWRPIFLIPAILGFILWIHIYFYLPSFKPDRAGFKINYLAALRDKTVISLCSYIFLISLFYHAVQQWLGVYFSLKLNLSQFLISMLITLTSLSGVFGEALGGWFSDAAGRVKIVNLGIILMIISVFLLIIKMPVAILSIIMVIWGLGWTFNHAAISTILTDLPKQFLNEAASLNSSIRFISGGLGAALSGHLMKKSFSLGFMVFGASLFILLFFTRFLKLEAGR